MVGVIARRVEDGDADETGGVHWEEESQDSTVPSLETGAGVGGVPTVGMPDVGEEAHRGRGERVVLGEFELGREDAALEGGALGPLDEALPVQHVVLGDGPGGDALGGVVGEGAVLLEQPALGGGLGHEGRALADECDEEKGESGRRDLRRVGS